MKKKKKMKISKEVIRLNEKNKNGRIYTEEIFLTALADYLLKKETFGAGVLYGELGHPKSFDIGLKNVSHTIESAKLKYPKVPRKLKKKLKKSGLYRKSILFADIQLLDTPKGKVAKSIIDRLVLAPRGTGKTDENGMVTDYQMFSIDLINKEDKA